MDRMSRVLLLGGAVLIGYLYTLKVDREMIDPGYRVTIEKPMTFPSKTFLVGKRKIAMMEQLIQRDQFEAFVRATGYVSFRERRGVTPTWLDHEGSVSWLNRDDAEAFIKWAASQKGRRAMAFRLPTVEELEAASLASEEYEWASNSDPRGYATAWSSSGPPLLRRDEDYWRQGSEPVGFRICWDVSLSN